MHLCRTLLNISLLSSVSLAVPTVGPLDQEVCCVYERKLKRRDGEAPEHYYPEGSDHIPKGTSPNKVLPRSILKRVDDYYCACGALFGSCNVTCANCTVSCNGPCVTSCAGKKTKQKKKRDPNLDTKLSSAPNEIEKRGPKPDSDLASATQAIEERDTNLDSDLSSAPQDIEKRDASVGPPLGNIEECCEYEQKRKRNDDPETHGAFYPNGGHVPPGTSPNKVLSRDILKREEDYTCVCFAIFGTCSVNCGVGGQNSSGGGKRKRTEVTQRRSLLVEKKKRDPSVGPPLGNIEECCEYEQKRKRSDDPESHGPFYPDDGHVPPETGPNKVLPREILKREEDYTCICFALFGKCSVNCGTGGQNSTGGKKKRGEF